MSRPRRRALPGPDGIAVATLLPPARTLRDVVRACEEDQPLSAADPRWEDFSLARGDDTSLALRRLFEWAADDAFVHAALVSHRGAGKTTELLRLAEAMQARYHPLYLATTVEMDPYDIEIEDLLLVIALAIEAEMRRVGTPLPPDLLARVAKWFDEVVRTTKWGQGYSAEIAGGVEAKGDIPFFASLLLSVKGVFKQESEHRTEVRSVLKKYPGTLLDSVNLLLDAANRTLTGGRRLLVIIDNLDRYSPAVIDRLLVGGADKFLGLRCDFIVTPPVDLVLRPKSHALDAFYQCKDLFTVRLRRPDQGYREFDGPGRDLMRAALARRIDLAQVFADDAAIDRLVAASGGAIRELLHLINQTALHARGDRLTLDDVEHALMRRRGRLRDLVNANGWMEALARLAREKQITHSSACLDLLYQRLAFKYDGQGWYDIHPLVAELPEFARAFTAAAAE